MKNKRLFRKRPNYIKLSGQLLWKLYVMSFEWLLTFFGFFIWFVFVHQYIRFRDNWFYLLNVFGFIIYSFWYFYPERGYEFDYPPKKHKELLALPLFTYAIVYYLLFRQELHLLIARTLRNIFG